jgi:hypothetical protein
MTIALSDRTPIVRVDEHDPVAEPADDVRAGGSFTVVHGCEAAA